jgi:hypothetical protein
MARSPEFELLSARLSDRSQEEAVLDRLGAVNALQPQFDVKTSINSDNGLTQYRDGTVNFFDGFSKSAFSRIYEVALLHDKDSSQQIEDRVSTPLESLAASYDIELIVPGKGDFLPHITLQPGNFGKDVDPRLREEKLRNLNSPDSGLREVAEGFIGETITLDKLVLAGSIIYLATGNPTRDEETFGNVVRLSEGRQKIKTIFEDTPGVPLEIPRGKVSEELPVGDRSYDPIIHATVGRITGGSREQLLDFAIAVSEQIEGSLLLKPIRAKVGDVFIGTADDHARHRGYKFPKP